MSFIKNLQWRVAEKNFDPTASINQNNLNKILDAIQLAPTSYGLQPFHLYIIDNPETKKELKLHGQDQSQFQDASHILIFTTISEIKPHIAEYIKASAKQNGLDSIQIKTQTQKLEDKFQNFTPTQIQLWSANQAYIALGFALAACAELHIDSCPLEGFNKDQFDKILALPKSQHSLVSLAIGYRMDLPQKPKIRLPKNYLITQI